MTSRRRRLSLRTIWIRSRCSESISASRIRLAAVRIGSGFTLLEIVLALAILAGALAALGEVMRMSRLSAERARDESHAQLIASSILGELVSGARPLADIQQAPVDVAAIPPWQHSILTNPTEYEQLLAVTVVVEQQLTPEQRPARVSFTRWMLDPNLARERQITSSGSDDSPDSEEDEP